MIVFLLPESRREEWNTLAHCALWARFSVAAPFRKGTIHTTRPSVWRRPVATHQPARPILPSVAEAPRDELMITIMIITLIEKGICAKTNYFHPVFSLCVFGKVVRRRNFCCVNCVNGWWFRNCGLGQMFGSIVDLRAHCPGHQVIAVMMIGRKGQGEGGDGGRQCFSPSLTTGDVGR